MYTVLGLLGAEIYQPSIWAWPRPRNAAVLDDGRGGGGGERNIERPAPAVNAGHMQPFPLLTGSLQKYIGPGYAQHPSYKGDDIDLGVHR